MKTAMIWGADGGIGRALVAQLHDEGWTILAITRRPATKQLTSLTPYIFEANVIDAYAVQQAVLTAGQEIEGVDLWIYAVGDITSVHLAAMSPDTWERILGANLTGAYLTAHYSLPLLAPDAHLVFIGALSQCLPGLTAYAAAKAGLEAMAQSLAKEVRPRRVTVVRPAAVATPLWEKTPWRLPADAWSPADLARRITEAYEQGHAGVLDL